MKNGTESAGAPVKLAAGILLSVAVAGGAILLQRTDLFARVIPLSPLILAIVLGFAINNALPVPEAARAGIRFSAKRLLRLAIVFLGFRLSLGEIGAVGPVALVTVLVASTATIVLTVWAGKKLGIPAKRAMLLGSGISICGASAIAAVDGVIRADEEDAAFAIGAITVLGTVFMFVYPLVYRALALPDTAYALWAGASIHEVAQVTAASGVLVDPAAQALAASVKMIRVLFVVPLSLVLLFVPWNGNANGVAADGDRGAATIAVPWFAVFFFAAVAVNSLSVLPGPVVSGIVTVDTWLMTVAMAALGLDISLRAMRRIGSRTLLLGIGSSLAISAISMAMILL